MLMDIFLVIFKVFFQMEGTTAFVADVLLFAMSLHVISQLRFAGEHLVAYIADEWRKWLVNFASMSSQLALVVVDTIATFQYMSWMNFVVMNLFLTESYIY